MRLRGILKDANFEPPQALRHLAAITDFDLFVSTTFDSLLESAINLERFGGAASTEVLSYSPNRVVDLPSERDRLQRPVVYHLFGKLSASPTYVISDEDLLEFICALQSEHLAPEKLFHELEHNHLLFIGSNFTNWLARLFLRMAKRQRLSDPARRRRGAGGRPHQRGRPPGGVPAAGERAHPHLRRRRALRRGAASRAGRRGASRGRTVRRTRAGALPAAGARDAATTRCSSATRARTCPRCSSIKAGLEAAGITTWFDYRPPRGGRRLRPQDPRNIARCSYFIPVVSATTQRRLEGYFRREWSYALDRARNMADGRAVHPAGEHRRHDRGRGARAGEFKALHFTQLPGGRGHAGVRRAAERTSCRRAPSERRRPARRRRPTRPPPSMRAIRGSGSPPSPRRRAPTSSAARRRSPSSPGACSASSSRCSSGNRASARPRSCAPDWCRGCAARATARSTCASTTPRGARARRADQAGDLRRAAALRRVDPGRAWRSRASRSGSSCTTATMCCAMSRARRSSRC